MHLGRYVANAALDVPDALATSTSAVEECNVVAIALWIVGIDEAQQRRFSRTIGTEQCPSLTGSHRPTHIVQNHRRAIAHVAMTQLEGVAVVDRLMQRHIGQQVDAAFCRKHLRNLPNHTRKPHLGNSEHLPHRELLHRQHKIGEWWNIHRVAQQQNHCSALAGNVVQQFVEK